jgi:hypothetical protein
LPCSSASAAQDCNAIDGCMWMGNTMSCEGTPDACSTHLASPVCEAAGCTWAICGGTVPACSTLEGLACVAQSGCSLN